uniref:Uncharacterized protein n=1 Tax=Arundo donax TaxID=35708 RepID=A0A0A8YST1_ARUDO
MLIEKLLNSVAPVFLKIDSQFRFPSHLVLDMSVGRISCNLVLDMSVGRISCKLHEGTAWIAFHHVIL